MSKVYLTGAGPGDIELLTLKALRVIREADVIIHAIAITPQDMERFDEYEVHEVS